SSVNVVGVFDLGISGAPNNQAVVQNGAKLLTGGGGLDSSGNQLIVTGPGSTWTVSLGTRIVVGASGSGNLLILSNGATANTEVDFSYVGRDSGANNNSMVVTGSGSTFDNRHGMIVGNNGSSNSLWITDGGTVLLNRFSDSTYGFILGA